MIQKTLETRIFVLFLQVIHIFIMLLCSNRLFFTSNYAYSWFNNEKYKICSDTTFVRMSNIYNLSRWKISLHEKLQCLQIYQETTFYMMMLQYHTISSLQFWIAVSLKILPLPDIWCKVCGWEIYRVEYTKMSYNYSLYGSSLLGF